MHADEPHILWGQHCNSQRGLDECCLRRPVWCCEPARAARLIVCRPCRMHPVTLMLMLQTFWSRTQPRTTGHMRSLRRCWIDKARPRQGMMSIRNYR